MKILLVGDYSADPRLGSAKVYTKLSEALRELGHHCDILSEEDLGTSSQTVYLRQAFAPVKALRAVNRAIRRQGTYDVIDIASAEGFYLGCRKRLGYYPRTAVISRSHGLEHLNYQRMLDDHDAGLLHKPWTRRLWYPAVRLTQVAGAARCADRLIVLNDGDRAFALRRKWKTAEEIDVIPHGISSRFVTGGDELTGARRGQGLLYCGTWTGMKGVDYLAPAISQLFEEGTRFPLTVLGGHVPPSLIRSAFSPAVQPLLTVLERADEAEVIRHYRRHDALVFCSTYEGFGMVLLEAMSQGLPSVSTSVGCAPLLIRDEENGLLVPPRDSATLGKAIKRMMTDPELRKRLGENAEKSAKTLTWHRTAILTIEAYRKALDGRRARKNAPSTMSGVQSGC